MNDAIALLAMSQIICLGGIAYLHFQLQAVRRLSARQRVRTEVHDNHNKPAPVPTRGHTEPVYSPQQARPPAPTFDTATWLDRTQNSGMDVPALARKLRRSEEEVRLLLHRQGSGR